jgi:hypothetical protein
MQLHYFFSQHTISSSKCAVGYRGLFISSTVHSFHKPQFQRLLETSTRLKLLLEYSVTIPQHGEHDDDQRSELNDKEFQLCPFSFTFHYFRLRASLPDISVYGTLRPDSHHCKLLLLFVSTPTNPLPCIQITSSLTKDTVPKDNRFW